jgi:threonine dehydratase
LRRYTTVPDREAAAGAIQAETGATLIPPYNYGPVICGQGTIGVEFMEQAGPSHGTPGQNEPSVWFGIKPKLLK